MAAALLEVTDLACRRGGRRVFESLSFSLAAGELLALTGRNGSGKTTLLRALALLVPADRGRVLWQNADVTSDREAWRAQLAWLGHLDGLKGDLTVRENLEVAQRLRGAGGSIDEALTVFDLMPLANRPARRDGRRGPSLRGGRRPWRAVITTERKRPSCRGRVTGRPKRLRGG
jgi:heme exporter protein A